MLSGLAFALALPAAAAHATGVRTAPAADTCPHGPVYPTTPDATVQSSSTKVFVGEKIEASGVKYCPNEDVRLTIAGKFVGTAHTDANGSFDPQVIVPGPAGNQQLCGVGASGLSTDADCLTLTTRSTAGSGGSQPSSGGTAFTGTEVAALTVAAAILLCAGLAFATAGRRRKTVVPS